MRKISTITTHTHNNIRLSNNKIQKRNALGIIQKKTNQKTSCHNEKKCVYI